MDNLQNIKYPIYIVSKGRYEKPLTANIFLQAKIPFKIAIEPQEYDNYCKTIPKEFILKLPFSNLGLGSYPARNHCFEDSIKNGFKKHFLFDDNIRSFVRFNNGIRTFKADPYLALNTLIEFTDRFIDVAISGYNYSCFVNKQNKKPFTINSHVYSGMLINNEIPFRWRLKYNEDIDICLQSLSAGWNTILLNAFLIEKISTVVKMKGGNQDELYKNNDPKKKLLKAKSLEMIWPQYVKTVMRFGRIHHSVSWHKHFKHPLKRLTAR